MAGREALASLVRSGASGGAHAFALGGPICIPPCVFPMAVGLASPHQRSRYDGFGARMQLWPRLLIDGQPWAQDGCEIGDRNLNACLWLCMRVTILNTQTFAPLTNLLVPLKERPWLPCACRDQVDSKSSFQYFGAYRRVGGLCRDTLVSLDLIGGVRPVRGVASPCTMVIRGGTKKMSTLKEAESSILAHCNQEKSSIQARWYMYPFHQHPTSKIPIR